MTAAPFTTAALVAMHRRAHAASLAELGMWKQAAAANVAADRAAAVAMAGMRVAKMARTADHVVTGIRAGGSAVSAGGFLLDEISNRAANNRPPDAAS